MDWIFSIGHRDHQAIGITVLIDLCLLLSSIRLSGSIKGLCMRRTLSVELNWTYEADIGNIYEHYGEGFFFLLVSCLIL